MSVFSNPSTTESSGVLVQGQASGPTPETQTQGRGGAGSLRFEKALSGDVDGGPRLRAEGAQDTPELDHAAGAPVLDRGSAITPGLPLPVAPAWASRLISLCLSFPI